MRDKDLYAQILGIVAPWQVESVELPLESGEVHVHLVHDAEAPVVCPKCEKEGTRHGKKKRGWRHLDTCQYATVIFAEVPRVECSEHGVHVVRVPWAEPGSRFTALFERLVIDWLFEASLTAVSRQTGLTWGQVARIQSRSVRRGLQRRQLENLSEIGVDETSFQKRHEYVTAVYDFPGNRVVYVADDRKRSSLDGFFEGLRPEQRASIDVVAMDMWEPYIRSVQAHVPGAEHKIAFDKFHVAQHLGEAVDKVRRQENRQLIAEGDERLKGTRYLWLQNPENMKTKSWNAFASLKNSTLKVARAWAIKEMAMQLWHYATRGWARRAWKAWIGWALRCRLEPIKKAARTVKNHLEGILNAIVLGITNARGEGMNAKIQWIKRLAYGYRNRANFRDAIYFHLGGLDLYPRP